MKNLASSSHSATLQLALLAWSVARCSASCTTFFASFPKLARISIVLKKLTS